MNGSRQILSFPEISSNAPVDAVRYLNPPHARRLITESPAEWREAVSNRINYLCHLPDGWDGYCAGPVDFRIGYFAIRMLESICSPKTPTPSVVPGINGDLQIEWHWADGDIELHVRAPSDVHAWRETSGTGKDGDELMLTIDFTDILPWIKDLVEPAGDIVEAAA